MKHKSITAFASIFLFIVAAALLALSLSSCKTSPRTVAGREIIADLNPIETAVITAQFTNFMGTSINPSDVTVSFAPRTDEALLRFRMNGNDYFLYLTREARELVREAVACYNEDFDATRLDRKMSQRKTERIYGQVEGCYMEWGLGALAMNGKGNPKIAVGYRFESGSPYFTITVYSVDNLNYKVGLSNIEKSIKYAIYMNKAQSLVLAEELNEAVLMRALDTVSLTDFTPDEYEADGADAYGEDDNGR